MIRTGKTWYFITVNYYIDNGNNPEVNIQLFDNIGKALSSKVSNDQITTLHLSKYASGIYYLSISNGEKATTQKIVNL